MKSTETMWIHGKCLGFVSQVLLIPLAPSPSACSGVKVLDGDQGLRIGGVVDCSRNLRQSGEDGNLGGRAPSATYLKQFRVVASILKPRSSTIRNRDRDQGPQLMMQVERAVAATLSITDLSDTKFKRSLRKSEQGEFRQVEQ